MSSTGVSSRDVGTVVGIAEDVRAGRRSAVEVLAASRSAVERSNETLVAFVHLDWEGAETRAAEIDALVAGGRDPGPLAGVPFGVKDLEDCAGMPTTYGSLVFAGATPRLLDDPHITRLKGAGGIPIGKTATSEFGFDQATRTRLWGVTRNPWNPSRTPGGSSGGSAAAVASGMVPFATGSDSGGSIRDPAAFTGLIGLKPSHGRVPRQVGSSDVGVRGVLTSTVGDHARLLDVLAGPDSRDKMSLPKPHVPFADLTEVLDVAGLSAVWSDDLGGHTPVESEIAAIARAAAEVLTTSVGIHLNTEGFDLVNDPNQVARQLSDHSAFALAVSRGIWPNRLDDLFERTRRAVESGARMDKRTLVRVQLAREELEREVAHLFDRYDLLLTPSVACAAFLAEGPIPDVIAGRDATLAGVEPFAALANLCWNPSISMPAGTTVGGLPVGLMITARHHRDDVLLRLARLQELLRPWPRLAPGFGAFDVGP